MRSYLIFALCMILSVSASMSTASVVMVFSALPHQGVADGFGGSGSDGGEPEAVNNMAWAIVVLTSLDADESFDGLKNLNPFDIDVSGQYLDTEQKYWYVFGENEQGALDVPRTVDRGIGGALGTLNAVDIGINVVVDDEEYGYLMNGHRFAIIWFPEDSAAAGSSYGYLEDPGFTLPNNGSSKNYYGLPVFQENKVFPAAEIIAIPEIGSIALVISGVACLAAIRMRRYRSV